MEVGNGIEILSWDNPWIVNGDSHFILGKKVKRSEYVSDVINFESMECDVELVTRSFDKQEAQAILDIPLLPQMVYMARDLDLFHMSWVKL